MNQLELNKEEQLQYEEFLHEISESLTKKYPGILCPELIKVQKNNSVYLEGIRISEQGESIAPGFYLESQFEEYQKGFFTVDELAEKLMQCYEKEKSNTFSGIKEFQFDWEKMRNQITFRLVNKERNQEILNEVPYEEFLDLALLYQYSIHVSGVIQGTILIRKEHLKTLNITKKELREAALQNMNHLCEPVVYEMKLLIEQLCGRTQKECLEHPFDTVTEEVSHGVQDVIPEEERLFGDVSQQEASEFDKNQLYVYTNKTGMYGAAALTDQEQLELFSKKIEGNFFILPSSVHEVIFLPDRGKMSVQNLAEMVKEVNETQVAETEFLSNSVYYYDSSLKKLRRLT